MELAGHESTSGQCGWICKLLGAVAQPGLPDRAASVASQFGIQLGMMGFMSVQIAVRLPDQMVAFLDKAVAAGTAPSRAALVARALEREMRRQAAENDAVILQQAGTADDLDELVAWSASHAAIDD